MRPERNQPYTIALPLAEVRKCKNPRAQKANFASRFNLIWPVQPFGKKQITFYFSEIMIVRRHPASLRGALRAIVTTREAGMRWTSRLRQTNATLADVKSCGPGAPTLALSWRVMILPMTVANKPGTPGRSRYKR
jgi:hypothetical protein